MNSGMKKSKKKDDRTTLRTRVSAARAQWHEWRRVHLEGFRKTKFYHGAAVLAKHPALQMLVLSVLVFLLVDMLSYRSPIGGLVHMVTRPHFFILNVLIVSIMMIPALFFRRRYFVYAVVSVFWITLGVINCVLLGMRVTPLEWVDFSIFRTGFAIVDKYMSLPEIILAAIGILLALAALTVMWFRLPRVPRVPFLRSGIGAGAVAIVLTGALLGAQAFGFVPKHFRNLADAYHEYGFAYCFSCSVFDRGIPKPASYSEQTVDKIKEQYTSLSTSTDTGTPNILFLQLESFFNVMDLQSVTFSEDPIPYFNSLKKAFPSGYLTVPSVGAGTANTEFEAISGMSLNYFGVGEYPYKTVLQDTVCEAMPFDLKTLGYTATAIHNHTGSFYDRNIVYPKLGFDYFISREYMETSDNRNQIGWVRDAVLTREIMDTLKFTDGRDYIYTVSVQGHGGYPATDVGGGFGITVGGIEDDGLAMEYQYYVNQLRDMDNFLRDLTAELAAYPEKVVLVMYGDHLPSLEIKEEDFTPGTANLLTTEYIVWSNYDIGARDEETGTTAIRRDVCAYQIGAYVTDLLDIHEGNVFRFHQALSDYQPAQEGTAYYRDLQTLQYDILYGEQYLYGGESPFSEAAMKMGIYPITIEDVTVKSGGIYITGTHFTPDSVVFYNGERTDTPLLIDSGHLAVPISDAREVLKPGDIIEIRQTGDDYALFSTIKYVYKENEMNP